MMRGKKLVRGAGKRGLEEREGSGWKGERASPERRRHVERTIGARAQEVYT